MRAPLLALATILLVPTVASAANDSIIALGVDAHTIVSRPCSPDSGDAALAVSGQGVAARLRLLWILGAELSYDLTSPTGGNLQWSGLIYLVPGSRFALYFLAGFGAANRADLFDIKGASTSYHAGLGTEIAFSSSWVLAADVRLSLPGAASALGGSGPAIGSLHDYYGRGAWQGNLGVRFYL